MVHGSPFDVRRRVSGWETRFRAALEQHRFTPFERGVSDCATMFGDAVVAIRGVDPIADCRSYRTAFGALRELRNAGFETVVELVQARFVEIPVALAQRGDLAFPAEVLSAIQCPLVVLGDFAVSKNQDAAMTFPRSALARAFAV